MNNCQRIHMSTWILFCSLIFFVLYVPFVLAEKIQKSGQDEILVVGTGRITGGNLAQARKNALSDALVRGVEAYLTNRLGSKGMMNNFPRIVHEVIPGAKDQIENFHILAEDRLEQDFKILVRLKVNEKMMEEILREIDLISMEGPPIRVLFLVSQYLSRENRYSYWWRDPESGSGLIPAELSLYREFQDRGFQPINRLLNVPEGDYSIEMKVLDLTDKMAIKWGNLFSAEVVIYGRCEILEGGDVSIFLKALDVEMESVITQDSQIEMIGDGSQGEDPVMGAIERATSGIATRISPTIIERFEPIEASTNRVEITIKGLKSFKQFREFEGFLKGDISGVKSVRQTRVKGNSISVSVEFSGEEDQFMERVINHENFPFLADLNRTENGGITIQIR